MGMFTNNLVIIHQSLDHMHIVQIFLLFMKQCYLQVLYV